ncbi:MAG: cell division protein FtsZ [Thermoplasmata archaeon]
MDENNASPEEMELIELLKSLKTKIIIVGCGGAGSNTITRIIDEGIQDVELIAMNTDAPHLYMTKAQKKVLLGKRLTRGLGAGALPEIGMKAALESEEDIKKMLEGSDIVFITAGLGGGTGTGSANVVAKIAKDLGALTVAVVTLPFSSEGRFRFENAMWGLEKLLNNADTVIVILNDKLLKLVPRMPLNKAFRVADEVLVRAIKGISEMITKPGLINLDYNDLKTTMKESGLAVIGLGESDGENRAEKATEMAVNSPLIDIDISGATGALIDVIGGDDMTVEEAHKVVQMVEQKLSNNSRIIWGASVRPEYKREMSVMVVLTGVKGIPKYTFSDQGIKIDIVK